MQTSQCNGMDLSYRTRIPSVNEDEPILTARALADAVEKFTEEFFGGAVLCESVDLDLQLLVNREGLAFLITAILTKVSGLGVCKISYSLADDGLNVDFAFAGSDDYSSAWGTELFACADKYGFSISLIERGVRIFVPLSYGTGSPLHSRGYDNFFDSLTAAYRIFRKKIIETL